MGSQRVDPVNVDPVTARQEPWIDQMAGLLKTAPGQVNTAGLQNPGATEVAGGNYINDVLGGKYLGQGNPYMQGMVGAATRPVQDWYNNASKDLGAQANMLGMSSSSPRLNQQVQLADKAGQQIGDISANLYGQNYANERGMQQNALGAGLSYSMAPLQRLAALQGLEMAPWQAQIGGLSNLLGLTQGQVTTPQYAPSPFAQAMGGLAGLAGAAVGGPMGGYIGNWLFNRNSATN
jgi:hypothetical protein